MVKQNKVAKCFTNTDIYEYLSIPTELYDNCLDQLSKFAAVPTSLLQF